MSIKRTLNNAMDSLSEYEELDDLGRSYLVDELLDIIDDIHSKDEWLEGRKYQQIMYMVEKGTEIPKPFSEIVAQSPISGEQYKLKVMMITDVRVNDNGNVVLDLLAKKLKN